MISLSGPTDEKQQCRKDMAGAGRERHRESTAREKEGWREPGKGGDRKGDSGAMSQQAEGFEEHATR